MQPTDNPYEVLEVDDRTFDVRTTLSVVVRFVLVGVLCGLISGIYMEQNARFAASTAGVLILPGLVFGFGIMISAIRFVPHRRLGGCVLFPFLTVIGFATIGAMFDVAADKWSFRTPQLTLWIVLSAYSIPGVLFLMMGCLLVATPKSWLRFAFTCGVICLITGCAPLITNEAPGVYRSGPRFLIAMFGAQVLMFLLFGWVLGDTIGDDDEWARTPEQTA